MGNVLFQQAQHMNDNINSNKEQANNPLHGLKLADILEQLVEKHGWEKLGKKIGMPATGEPKFLDTIVELAALGTSGICICAIALLIGLSASTRDFFSSSAESLLA